MKLHFKYCPFMTLLTRDVMMHCELVENQEK